jgi:hypothetical protein
MKLDLTLEASKESLLNLLYIAIQGAQMDYETEVTNLQKDLEGGSVLEKRGDIEEQIKAITEREERLVNLEIARRWVQARVVSPEEPELAATVIHKVDIKALFGWDR